MGIGCDGVEVFSFFAFELGDSSGGPGTNDLDVGLAIALLGDERYAEIGERLRREGFGPDSNEQGNPTPQRWKLGDLDVTIDFLLPPIPGAERGGNIHPLEGDFAALIRETLRMGQLDRPDQRRRHLRGRDPFAQETVFYGPAWQPGPGREAGRIDC